MKSKSADPWYVHAILYGIIVILTVVLIKVAILDPQEIAASEKFNRSESRLRMDNIKEAEILWQKKYGKFTDNLDDLILFLKDDPFVDSVMNAFDSLTMKPANPFIPLSHGEFSPESLKWTPKSHKVYTLQVDTSMSVDTTVNRRGDVIKIDSTVIIGNRYYLEDPDGYGTVGDLYNDALKNTPSWQ